MAARFLVSLAGIICLALPGIALADDGARMLTLDHYVHVKSSAPAIMAQDAEIYVREKVLASTVARGSAPANRIALFVHGAGTPAEVAFDVPYRDYSWMAYLARAGFDVFAMDMTGYGRSTRPAAMNDPCNLSQEQQAQFVGNVLKANCAPSYDRPITTMSSDWNDVGSVVDYLRGLRHVDKIALVGWSQGGPRAAGYAAQNPDKIAKLVVLAPAYNRDMPLGPPTALPATDAPMNSQSLADFTSNWDRQVGCAGQYEPEASRAIWAGMIASDPVGATWGPGVRRAPQVPSWGFNKAVAGKLQIPFLMISGQHDRQVAPQRVRDLFADLAAKQKVFIDLACSSHNAMWEKNHLLLFQASLEWLRDGTVQGKQQGEIRLGYSE
jgi:pimeloyl-ACP methyl ester carboxylesterase